MSLTGILSTIGGLFATVGLILLRWYRSRALRAENDSAAAVESVQQVQDEKNRQIAISYDVNEYYRLRAQGLSPAEALDKVQEKRK